MISRPISPSPLPAIPLPFDSIDASLAVEELSDLLAEIPDLCERCKAALQIALSAVARSSGALLVQGPSDSGPVLCVSSNLPQGLAAMLEDTTSPIHRLVTRVFTDELAPNPGVWSAETAPGEWVVALPLSAKAGLQGVLFIIGEPLSRVELERLATFVRPIGRAIRSLRASRAADTSYGARLTQKLKVANADLEASHYELLHSRNTLRALFDSMPAALYIVDHSYKLIAINMFLANRTGKAPQALVGRTCYACLYDRTEPCLGCRVKETLITGQITGRAERRRSGEEEDCTDWEISTYSITGQNNEVIQAILLEQDVTEKRRMEGLIAQSEKLAAVGQLAAGVAHEINNPLTAIIANAQILQRQLPRDAEIQESIELISKAGARAAQVVRNLLDFARKEEYVLAETDVNDTIRKALALVHHELLARSINLVFEPSTDLPLIKASQDHLQGVWLNLLMNAIDSIDEDQGCIRVTTGQVGNELRVSILDNGKGMAPERVNRIFEPFYTTKAPGRGTGLGLPVVHRIVKQHGGLILVDSKVGTGTEFTVSLPIA